MATAQVLNPFGALEAMVSRHVAAHLSNATATWLVGGRAGIRRVDGLRVHLARPNALALEGVVNDFNPLASALAADFAGAARGDFLLITSDQGGPALAFEVARVNANGVGLLTLELREADL